MSKKQKPFGRGAGILLPVTALPSFHGIGTFGKEAYNFIDLLKMAGQKYWQVLPLGPTSYGDSPYQSFSAFAGNPYFIDLDILSEEGLIEADDIKAYDWGDNPADIDYAKIYDSRFIILRKAFDNWKESIPSEYKDFCSQNSDWLSDYSSYMAVKTDFENKPWLLWDEDIRMREPEAVRKYTKKLEAEIFFWSFCQFKFFEQWNKLKIYANRSGIKIIGDIPIYVALDSADVWIHSEQFQLDSHKQPTRVAGVPPDMFSATGQLWGNPLYNWELMEREGFSWWKKRMEFSAQIYDIIRIDHFVGFAHYYSIPAGEDTAENGVWIDGPREKLLDAVTSVIGGKKIIAEDLGIVIPEMRAMMKKFGLPGMKILQFAFDSGSGNENLPMHYTRDFAVYGGTHDNEPLAGYFSHQPRKTIRYAKDYLGVHFAKDLPMAVIRSGYASAADTAVFQMQDLLGLGSDSRMNTPSTIGINWRWRLTKNQLTDKLCEEIRFLTKTYGR